MENRRVPALIALGGLVVATALFFLLRDLETADEPTERAATPAGKEQSQPAAGANAPGKPKPKPEPAEPEIATIEVRGGEPVGGVAELEFEEGDEIRVDVVSDAADELHLHAYDVYLDLEPGKPAELRVPATIGGVVELESHTTGVLLAEIAVVPN